MLKFGQTIFLVQIQSDGGRKLLHGEVTASIDVGIDVFFRQRDVVLSKNEHIDLLAEIDGKLFKFQAAAIHSDSVSGNAPIEPATSGTLIRFLIVGQAIPAESRESFRVMTGEVQMIARYENYRKCRVVDLSASGLAIISPRELKVGDFGRLILEYQDILIECRTRVQSCLALQDGGYRCGLKVPNCEVVAHNGLRRLTALIERTRLSHLRHSA